MMIVAPEHDLLSIGALASHLQKSVRSIEQAAAELGIEPAMRINMVCHFDGEQVERLREHLERSR